MRPNDARFGAASRSSPADATTAHNSPGSIGRLKRRLITSSMRRWLRITGQRSRIFC